MHDGRHAIDGGKRGACGVVGEMGCGFGLGAELRSAGEEGWRLSLRKGWMMTAIGMGKCKARVFLACILVLSRFYRRVLLESACGILGHLKTRKKVLRDPPTSISHQTCDL